MDILHLNGFFSVAFGARLYNGVPYRKSRTLEVTNSSRWFTSNIIAVVIGNQTILSEMGAFFERIKFDGYRFFLSVMHSLQKGAIPFMQWISFSIWLCKNENHHDYEFNESLSVVQLVFCSFDMAFIARFERCVDSNATDDIVCHVNNQSALII